MKTYQGPDAVKAEDKIAPKLYDDGNKDKDAATVSGEIAHVKDYLVITETVVDNVYAFDATIYFSEDITVLQEVYYTKGDLSLAGSDFNITLNGSKLYNGKDYAVVKYGKTTLGDENVGYVTIRLFGKDYKENDKTVGKKLEGDLAIELVDSPQYVMDPRKNVIADFDPIEVDNLEVIRKNLAKQ